MLALTTLWHASVLWLQTVLSARHSRGTPMAMWASVQDHNIYDTLSVALVRLPYWLATSIKEVEQRLTMLGEVECRLFVGGAFDLVYLGRHCVGLQYPAEEVDQSSTMRG